jgi:NADH-quinone oxidoreductase subunit N
LCAAISAYYYFRVIQAMYFKESDAVVVAEADINPGFKALLVITAALIILLGIYPGMLLDWLYY